MTCQVGDCPLVDDSEGGDDAVDEVDTDQDTGFVGVWQERHQCSANHAWYTAPCQPRPSVACMTDSKADSKCTDDGNDTSWHVEQSRLWSGELEAANECCRVCGDDTGGDGDL